MIAKSFNKNYFFFKKSKSLVIFICSTWWGRMFGIYITWHLNKQNFALAMLCKCTHSHRYNWINMLTPTSTYYYDCYCYCYSLLQINFHTSGHVHIVFLETTWFFLLLLACDFYLLALGLLNVLLLHLSFNKVQHFSALARSVRVSQVLPSAVTSSSSSFKNLKLNQLCWLSDSCNCVQLY